jgi:hypothetical protein
MSDTNSDSVTYKEGSLGGAGLFRLREAIHPTPNTG